ncbi:hypothetical protein V5O48_011810 [Marasmius crinis-equi]|uniref:Nephrocystin 3-like N-terminal domain-containing protein n=1 Tax=Marasmius crinis-equi TaxID=585013 RepID=A0ABR3F4L2_9AGAR
MSFFTNAHGTTIYHGQFNSVGGNQTNNSTVNAQVALQILSQTLADVGGAHNSEARYPPPRCHPETREEVRRLITDQVRSWKESWYIYWLYGPAGAGKSAVAQSISEECHASGDLIASYFFSRDHPKRNTPTYIFLTVTYGLARAVPELQEPIGQVIRTNPAILHSSLEEQFVQLIVNPCRWLTQREKWGSRPRLMVVDGLDECEGSQMQTRILSIIAKAVREPEGLPLQFLICSRPEPTIREFFDTKVFEPAFWYHVLDNDTSTYRDIYIFLRDGFAKIREDVKYRSIRFPPTWPDPDDVHTLVRKSDGQFVYVVTILRFVGEEFDPCRRLKVVLGLVPNVDGDSPYKDLDVLYHHVLSTNPKQRKTFMNILGFVLYFRSIYEDFSLPELEILLDISRGEAALALRGLHSVLDIANEKVLIRHASFTDLLKDKSRSGTFFVDQAYFKSFYPSCFIRFLNRVLDNGR